MKMLPLATASEQDFDAIFATNVRGTFNVLKQAATRVRDGGRIITLSSSVAAMSFPNYGPYAASKAAVEVLTRTLANELRGRQITVNAVAPGATATELFFEGKSKEQIDRFTKLARSSGSGLRKTSLMWWRFSPVQGAAGSTDKCCANGGYV